MRKTFRASVLMLALCCPVFAGDIPNPPIAPPQPPTPAVQAPSTDGQIDTGATASTADSDLQNSAAITFVEILLNLLALS